MNQLRTFLFACVAGATAFLPLITQAQTPTHSTSVRLSVPIGGTSTINGGLAEYLVVIYRYLLGIVTIVAIIMVIYGGFRYLMGATTGDVKTGKTVIQDALGGMAVLFLAYFILYNVNPKTVNLKMPGLTSIQSANVRVRSVEDAIRDSIGATDTVTTRRTADLVGCTATQWTLADASEQVRTSLPRGTEDPLLRLRQQNVGSVDSAACYTKRAVTEKCDANIQCISQNCTLPSGVRDAQAIPASFRAPTDASQGAGTCALSTTPNTTAGTNPTTPTGSPVSTLSCPADRWNYQSMLADARILLRRSGARVSDLVPGAQTDLSINLDECFPRRTAGQRCDGSIQCASSTCAGIPEGNTVNSLAAFTSPRDVTAGLGTCR